MPLNILQRQPGTQPLGTTSVYRQGSTRGDHLCLAGPAGTGKSHLSEALGRAACEAGQRVRFFSADELLEALYHGLADNTVGRLIGGLLRNDLVVIDDLGFTTTDRVAAEHLFRLVSAAYEQRSLIDLPVQVAVVKRVENVGRREQWPIMQHPHRPAEQPMALPVVVVRSVGGDELEQRSGNDRKPSSRGCRPCGGIERRSLLIDVR